MTSRSRLVIVVAVLVSLGVSACGEGDGPRLTLPSRPTDADQPTATEAPPTETAVPPVDTDPPSAAPETIAPPVVTEAPQVTAAPPAPETTTGGVAPPPATDTVSPDGGGDDGGSGWLIWVVIAAAALGVIAWVAGRRRTKPPAWLPETVGVLDRTDQLTRHLAPLEAAGLRVVAAEDGRLAAALMADVQRLVAAAPDEQRRTALAGLIDPLARLHTSLNAVALAPSAAPETEAAAVRSASVDLYTASATARAVLAPSPPAAV